MKQVCQENEEFDHEHPYACITLHPAFHIKCLYTTGLRNANYKFRQKGIDDRQVNENEKLRFTAYSSTLNGSTAG